MIFCPFKNLNNLTFAIDYISSVEMIPKNASFTHSLKGRGENGFIFILEGECEFSFNGEKINAPKDTLVFLPKGTKHSYERKSQSIKYIRIDFDAYSIPDMEYIIFSKTPLKIFDKTPDKCVNILKQLTKSFILNHTLSEKALLFELLSNICSFFENKPSKDNCMSVLNAINYIEKNYTKNFEKSNLAKMCNMSDSYFRTRFKTVTGLSPTEYQNRLRCEKAKQLILSYNINISKISEMLGFESVYYFSRFFKKSTGVSPLNFKKLNN
ncbi:MAG: AraC family transcriptional regulator [Ruminococcaceae bacterium]|nr:AraC family transcriptional regulator [Oscillospiraceae bacterium]